MEKNPVLVVPTIAGDDMPPVLARPDIRWRDLDVQRFLMWNCSIFFCIRCVIYPSMLIKTRLQAQRKVHQFYGTAPNFCSATAILAYGTH
jgi:hypothetical protein